MPSTRSSSVPRIPYYGDLSVAAVRTDPLLLESQATERLGDIFGYHVGGRYAVFINRPTMIAHVLQGNNRNYGKARTPELEMLLPMLGKGLMTSEGAEWVRQRTMLQPPFRKEVVPTYLAAIESATSELIERWRLHPLGVPIEISQEMSVLAVKVVARALFRSDLDDDAPKIAEAAEVMNAFVADFALTDALALESFDHAREVLRNSVRNVFRRWAPPVPAGADFLGAPRRLGGARGRDHRSSRHLPDGRPRDDSKGAVLDAVSSRGSRGRPGTRPQRSALRFRRRGHHARGHGNSTRLLLDGDPGIHEAIPAGLVRNAHRNP